MLDIDPGGEGRPQWWIAHNPNLDQVAIFAPGVREPVSFWHGPGALGIAMRTVQALNRMEAAG